jgi:hypothetical protein
MIAASAMSVAPRWPFDEWTSIFGSACSRTAVSHRLCTNNGNFVAESSSSKSEWIVREVGVALRGGGVRVSQQSSNDLETQSG